IVEQFWPYFGAIMEKTFKEILEPKIRGKNVHLKTCTFTKIHLGDKCPKIKGVKTYTKEVDRRQLYGTLRVILEPLLTDIPFFGAVTILLSDSLIQDLIAARLVLPNRLTVPLKKNMNVAQLRFPIPRGVLRVYLLEAENLVQKDNFLGAIRGKSDPYALLRVGLVQLRSKTIQRDLNPIWNEMFEFVVHEVPGQDLEVDLYDEDPDKDDFLGSLVINLVDVMKDKIVDEWFPLSKIASGHVHLKLEWFSLVTNQEKLSESKNGLSTGMLIVYLDSALNLPKNQLEYSNGEYGAKKYRKDRYLKKIEREPSSFVLLTVGNKTHKSKTCNFTKDPAWRQAFTFFVHSAPSQSLHLEIKDKEKENALGTLVISLARLLKNPEMTLEQNFQLDHSGVDSSIKLKIVLRALHIEVPDSENTNNGANALKPVPASAPEQNEDQNKAQLPPPHPPPPPPPPPVELPKAVQGNKESDVPERKNDNVDSNAKSNGNEKLSEPIVIEAVAGINEQGVTGGLDPKFLTLPETTGVPPTLPALQRLQVAPSLASLGTEASSIMDITCSNLNLNNGTLSDGRSMGEIHITVRYASLRQSLIVLKFSAMLSAWRISICSHLLAPDKRWITRRKTTVKKKTLNPRYDEKFEFNDTLEDIKKRALDVAVKNRKSLISHERKEFGKVLIDLSKEDLVKGFSQWYQLTINGQPKS
ncbi:putative Extended synaptotagmin-3 protein, partial [Naja naja]